MPFFVPLLAAFTGILAFLGAGPIAARLGGWSRLAKSYPAAFPFEGKKLLASGAMGPANYGFSLLLGADARGLSLETTGFVRTGHKPLFIPWSDVTAREVSGLFYPRALVGFQKAPGVTLRLPKKTVLELKELAGCADAFSGVD